MSAETARAFRSIWSHLYQTSFRQGFIDAGGVRTRYVQAGKPDGPAVLMLHGTGGSWEAFCGTLGPHAEYFNCYAIDMVGNGFSAKPDVDCEIPVYVEHVKNFMAAAGLKKVSIIGVSLGAWVAARFAVTHPQLLDKLELLSPSGLLFDPASMQSTRGQRSKAVDDPTWENVEPIFKTLIHDPANRIDDLIALRQALYRHPDAKAAMAHVLVLQDPEVRKRNLVTDAEWRGIKAQTLIVGSVDDPNIFLDTARKASLLMPNARYVEMRHVAHWPQFEDPNAFNKISLDFLLGR
jgi:2-hydroxy-6-oxonona-2,4-dienedioate hydrolase